MFRDRSSFTEYVTDSGPTVTLGDHSRISSVGRGSAQFDMQGRTVELQNAFHVPKLSKNLFSIGQSTSTGAKFLFDGDHMHIYSPHGFQPPKGDLIADVRKGADNLYRMSSSQRRSVEQLQPQSAQFTTQKGAVVRQTWHQRLGHVNDRDLETLIRRSATGIKVREQRDAPSGQICEPCVMSKMTRFPFLPSTPKTSRPGELIHSDLKGPFRFPAVDGPWRYFVTYVDYHTRFTKVFLLEHKSDQLRAFRIYEATITNKFDSPVRAVESFQSDNGGEYMSKAVQDYFETKGISHRRTVPYNPESNGIAERTNRTIMETCEALRTQAKLPEGFWSFFVFLAVYLMNRRPHSALGGRTPFEAWWGRKPGLSHLRVPGCDAWSLNPPARRSSQDPRARRGIFVGYAPKQKAYRLWDPEREELITSNHVLFDESSFTFGRDGEVSPSSIPSTGSNLQNSSEVPDDDLHISLPPDAADSPPRAVQPDSCPEPIPMDDSDSDCDSDAADGSERPEDAAPQQADSNDEIEAAQPERRYPSRNRRPPPEWWKASPPEVHLASTLHGNDSKVLDDTVSHIGHCAFQASAGRRQPRNDKLPRPSLDGVMASDIPTTGLSLRQALNGPYGV
jgi:transposase InsO family protein